MAVTKVGKKRITKNSNKKKIALKRAGGKKLTKSEVAARIARIRKIFSKGATGRPGSNKNKEVIDFKKFGNHPTSWTQFEQVVWNDGDWSNVKK